MIGDRSFREPKYGEVSFETYCKERWGFTRDRAHQLIDAAQVSNVLTTVSNLPATEFTISAMGEAVRLELNHYIMSHSEIDRAYYIAAAEQMTKVNAAFSEWCDALKILDNEREIGRAALIYNQEVNRSNELRGDWNEANGRTRFGMPKA